MAAFSILLISLAAGAQDWGSEDDSWDTPTRSPTRSRSEAQRQTRSNVPTVQELIPGWSIRAGLGFTSDPETLLLDFGVPYAFDRWVSAGPMLQVGIDEHDTIVAPTLDVTVRVPDLPGESLDRLHPYGLVGIGFAVIEDDNRQNDNVSVGFLVHFGVGLEYQVSDHLYLDSQMKFNFLPEETLDVDFFYSWQVGGVRIAF